MTQSTFIQRIAEYIQTHYNLQTQDVTVVFPNKRAAYHLRNAFKESCQQTIWLPQTISIEEAVTQWSGINLADNIDLLFELIDINAELHSGQSRDLSVFGSQAAQMAKDFDEIDQYGIDAKSVFNYVLENKKLGLWDFDTLKTKEKEQKYLNFFHSLYDYYLRLRARLTEKGLGYYGMITRHLAETPKAELQEKVGEGHIVFAGFNALTATEESIFDTLVKSGKAKVLFDYDSYYVDDPNNEAGFFARKHRKRHPEWMADGLTNRLTTEAKTLHIISASGNTLQAKALQAKLEQSSDANQAVILADEHLLVPVLNAIPDHEVYRDFKVSMGYPIVNTPVHQFVKAHLMLSRRNTLKRNISEGGTQRVATGWYIWHIVRLMQLEIIRIVFPKTETIAFNRWKSEAIGSGKFIFEAADIDSLTDMPNLQSFLRILLTTDKEPLKVLAAINQSLSFLSATLMARPDKDTMTFLLNQLGETGKMVSRLTQIAERNVSYVNDLQSIEILYRLLSAGTTLKWSSSNVEGLQIMGMLETRNLDFKRLHVLSVNEGILPPDKPQGSFIPQFIRYAYGLPGYAESQAVVAYHFYHLLQNGEDIHLYYNNLSETSGGEASRFILQVKHELTRNANITISEEQFACVAKSSVETKALSASKDKALERLHYIIEEKGLSPSALSTYLNCSLKYHLRYIAQIEDNSVEEDVGVNDIGTVIHDTLELLLTDYLPRNGQQQMIDKALFDNVILPRWKDKMEEAIANKFPNGFPDVGFNYLNRVTIEQQLKSYLAYTSKQLENGSLSIIETEGELKATLSIPRANCVFYGRADRIDQFEGMTRVIDYKTGHVETSDLRLPVRHSGESDLDYLRQIPDKALQLLIYKYLYLKGHPTLQPEQVTAAIHGLRYTSGIEFCLTKASPTKADTDADSSFLDDSTFITDMEAMLEAVVDEMLDPTIPFTQTTDDKKCGYCEFKTICRRNAPK